MDLTNGAMFGFVAVLALSYAVPRIEALRRYPPLFWAVNAVDVGFVLAVALAGAGVLEPLVRFLIGLVLLLHLAQNFATRSRWDAEDRIERLEAEQRERFSGDSAEP